MQPQHLRRLTDTDTDTDIGKGPGVCLAQALDAIDAIDYPMFAVDAEGAATWVNRAARHVLRHGRPLRLDASGRLRAHGEPADDMLRRACEQASRRGLRRWFALDDAGASVAVLPLPRGSDPAAAAALVVLGRSMLCERLSLEGYARAHGLTPAETDVLTALIAGVSPVGIAQRHRVALSTVRTQIGNVRAKTGTRSVGALVATLAVLPPMPGVLTGVR